MRDMLGVLVGVLAVLLVTARPNYLYVRYDTRQFEYESQPASVSWLAICFAAITAGLFCVTAWWQLAGWPALARLDSATIQHRAGHSYLAPGPSAPLFGSIENDGPGHENASGLVIEEDGVPLGPAHSLHDDVALKGAGRYSHWGNAIIFSTTDNTNPSLNDRVYKIAYNVRPSFTTWFSLLVLACGFVLSRAGNAIVRFAVFRVLNTGRAGARLTCALALFTIVVFSMIGFGNSVQLDPKSFQQFDHTLYSTELASTNSWLLRALGWAPIPSTAILTEDGRPYGPNYLAPKIVPEPDGAGNSERARLLFSALDSSDPRTNGREYRLIYRVFPGIGWWLVAFCALSLLALTPPSRLEAHLQLSAYGPALVPLVFSIAVLLAAILLAEQFELGLTAPTDPHSTILGTAKAPYSDALLWMFGAVQLSMERWHVQLDPYDYRPTISILFGSILPIFRRVDAIPIFFFSSFLCTVFVSSSLLATTRIGWAVGSWCILTALLPHASLWQTLVTNPMPDLPALVFTLTGTVFVLYGLERSDTFSFCVGLFSFGIAAAIRGAMLPAGLSILGLWWWKYPRASSLIRACALVSFAIPIILDNFFQHILHTMNNAPVALYCAATDPTHFWTPECQLRFQQGAITSARALKIYLQFISSSKGLMTFVTGLSERIRYDLSSLVGPPFFGALLLALAYRLRSTSENGSYLTSAPWIKWAKADLVVICLLLFLNIPFIDLALLIALCWFVVLRRDFISFVCLSVYISGLFMMSIFGATLINGINTDRAISTFSFALPLGLLASVMAFDTDRSYFALNIPRVARQIPSAIAGFTFVALYLGVWFVPFSWRSKYFSEDHRSNVALKIFDDPAVNRSGYYLLKKNIYGTTRAYPVYTVRDDLAIGATRRFESLATDAVESKTFREPNRLVP